MRKIFKCRVTIFLLLSWVSLSAIGYIGKDDIYRKYKHDLKTTPYFVLVFEGIHDGIYPWNMGSDILARTPWEHVLEGGSTEEEYAKEDTIPTEVQNTDDSELVAETETKEFINVDDNYFDDAVFIGDSRTVGLHDYGGLEKATFYATVGLNVYDMWTEKFCEVDGEKVTLEEALSARQYRKVYFQIGINEMGRGTVDSFMQAYGEAVEKLAQLQPDAIIYVQGIMRVTKEKSDSDKIFNNPGIQVRNDRIKLLADNIKIFYIDMNEVVCDYQGNLRDDLTFDNLHLYASKYNIWVDFLKTKGIALESS